MTISWSGAVFAVMEHFMVTISSTFTGSCAPVLLLDAVGVAKVVGCSSSGAGGYGWGFW